MFFASRYNEGQQQARRNQQAQARAAAWNSVHASIGSFADGYTTL
ncbi:MAG: hypothetical protein WCK83_00050 [Burkholderiales bacterium]